MGFSENFPREARARLDSGFFSPRPRCPRTAAARVRSAARLAHGPSSARARSDAATSSRGPGATSRAFVASRKARGSRRGFPGAATARRIIPRSIVLEGSSVSRRASSRSARGVNRPPSRRVPRDVLRVAPARLLRRGLDPRDPRGARGRARGRARDHERSRGHPPVRVRVVRGADISPPRRRPGPRPPARFRASDAALARAREPPRVRRALPRRG